MSAPHPPLSMFTIYRSPSDYPNKFVVREWLISGGPLRQVKEPTVICDSLQAARICLQTLHPGLTCLGRAPDDEAAIEESWV